MEAPHSVCLTDGEYNVEIKEMKGMKRSDRQNAMMWSIVNQICKKINGNIADSYELYCQLLEMSDAPRDDIKCKHEALDTVKVLMKHIKVVSQEIENGELWDYCWVFKGISEMDTKEANQLIDTVINYAYEVGIDIDENYWRKVLG